MMILIMLLAGIIGLLHLFIMYLEMFADPKKQAATFSMPLEFVQQKNAQIALHNMGIYNGSLGAVIILSLFFFSGTTLLHILTLLLLFVLVVGLYGGKTVTKSIYLIQALPAAIVLLLILL